MQNIWISISFHSIIHNHENKNICRVKIQNSAEYHTFEKYKLEIYWIREKFFWGVTCIHKKKKYKVQNLHT